MSASAKAPSSDVGTAFRQFVEGRASSVPLPGSGSTWQRFEALRTCAAEDLSLARLVEGHLDALAILAEAGHGIRPGVAYGVWASRSRNGGTVARPVDGGWRLTGSKSFCSGSGLIDRALVTADAPDGYRLIDLDLEEHVTSVEPNSWPAVGMADSVSESLTFGGPVVSESDLIGGAGFYTNRCGFWFGAIGVAACWYGGASGLVAHLIDTLDAEPGDHVSAELGRAVAQLGAMHDSLSNAAKDIDEDPEDLLERARFTALKVRQVVHDLSADVLSTVAAAGGARPLCHDRAQARRAADLYVYLAQHHGAADAAELGRLSLRMHSWL